MSVWAKHKARMRKAVHSAFLLSGDLIRAGQETVNLSVRYHNKIALMGDLMEAGYSEVIDGVDRAIFNREELKEKGITLVRGNIIQLTDPGFEEIKFSLEAQEPYNGPIEVKWQVKRIDRSGNTR
ncbi:hypothetical protein JT321_gp28 [Providencia phage Kokobel1]|uniref:Uncharacterized protein n=1 Tax=Providencia phage Kokobel1 TaxID=2783540 RepID=A0A873WNF2_9CAUD|nr:hypothetical protein JT321_gp28 [Providencia phage Kokobel1]QPB11455.1 hypothetical protein [Providencia phage Kokobel1]